MGGERIAKFKSTLGDKSVFFRQLSQKQTFSNEGVCENSPHETTNCSKQFTMDCFPAENST